MAWDDSKQHSGRLASGGFEEFGQLTLGADGTLKVPTRLKTIWSVQLTGGVTGGAVLWSAGTLGTGADAGTVLVTSSVAAATLFHYRFTGLQ